MFLWDLEEYFDRLFKEEEALIKKEEEEEAKREMERCEERRREEERERERALEKERAAAREAEFARERAETSSRIARLEERVRKAERNPVAKFFKGIGLILATPLAAVFYPPALPDMAEEIGESFKNSNNAMTSSIKEEEELIKTEREEEAKREKERCEELQREEERERERAREREKAAAREAEIANEIAALHRRAAEMEARLRQSECNLL
ncbi:hypothetical protein MTO96_003928 [Rhipicephalus appendiculatus]